MTDVESVHKLDSTHREMLAALRADARLSVAALAAQLGISRSSAYARLNTLIESGVLERFTIDINPTKVGKQVSALVFVSIMQSKWNEFIAELDTLDELDYFAITTGEYDAMLLIRADDVPGIQGAVVGVISQWPSVTDTQTVFLMHESRHDYRLDPTDPTKAPPNPFGAMTYTSTPPRAGVMPETDS